MAFFVILGMEFQSSQTLQLLIAADIKDMYVHKDSTFNKAHTHHFRVSYSDIHVGNGITKILW